MATTLARILGDIVLTGELEQLLLAILRHEKWRREAKSLRAFSLTPHTKQEGTDMDKFKNDEPAFLLGYEARDAHDNLTTIQSPVWTITDPAQATLEPQGDGSTVKFTALGKDGVGQVQLNGDADLGDGVRPITALYDFEILPGDAVVLDVKRLGPA